MSIQSEPRTPYYLIYKSKLMDNMKIIDRVREQSGAKALLALKCFATWSVFDLMRKHMDGTTSSSLNDVRLGREKFGGETHAYSVAWADHEIDEAVFRAAVPVSIQSCTARSSSLGPCRTGSQQWVQRPFT